MQEINEKIEKVNKSKTETVRSIQVMKDSDILFFLVDSSYDNKEILQAISILLSGQLTMGLQVKVSKNSAALN